MINMSDSQSAGKRVEFRPLPLDLDGYESKYYITNDGRVYSEYLGDFLKTFYSRGGYVRVKLNYGDRSKKMMVHRLVAMAFIPNPDNKPHVDHINCNRSDNRVENLQWVTPKENVQLAVERGNKDSMEYVFINRVTGQELRFTNRYQILKHFKGVCMRYIRSIANGERRPMEGMFKDWDIYRIPLKKTHPKLQRLSPAGEYSQAAGNGKDLTA